MNGLSTLHHVGVTVADLDRAAHFWMRLLGRTARDRRLLDGPGLGSLVGYPHARIDSCWFDLPGGAALELLEYLHPAEAALSAGTAHPGNVHVCLQVDDMATAHAHACACGAQAVSDAPIQVQAGPRAGTWIAYLRTHDGLTLELHQPPR